jgi:hypothetical protein
MSATVLHKKFKLAFRRTIFISKSLPMVDEEENTVVPSYIKRRTQERYLVENREKKQNKILIMTINSYSPFCFFWKKFLTWTAKHKNIA